MSAWRTIDSAPKDGRAYLLYLPGVQGYYARQDMHPGFWCHDHWQSCMNGGHLYPSHWQHLPEPPA